MGQKSHPPLVQRCGDALPDGSLQIDFFSFVDLFCSVLRFVLFCLVSFRFVFVLFLLSFCLFCLFSFLLLYLGAP